MTAASGRPAGGAGPELVDRDRLRLLGLAHRAGRAVIGTRAVQAAGRAQSLHALVVARDAAPNALERVRAAASGLRVLRLGTLESLGRAVGRDSVAVVGVTDRGLARRLGAVAEGIQGSSVRGRRGRMREAPGRRSR